LCIAGLTNRSSNLLSSSTKKNLGIVYLLLGGVEKDTFIRLIFFFIRENSN
jgi:hypothetical protein